MASRSRAYPPDIQAELQLNYAPPCSICHQHGQTGLGTPIEPFAWSMRARGLDGSSGSLHPALVSEDMEHVDSDGDGIPDIEELKNGTDVNSPANDCIIPSGTPIDDGQCTPGIAASPSPTCSVGRAGAASFPVGTFMLGALVWLAFRRRL